jgi:hypothetical protein
MMLPQTIDRREFIAAAIRGLIGTVTAFNPEDRTQQSSGLRALREDKSLSARVSTDGAPVNLEHLLTSLSLGSPAKLSCARTLSGCRVAVFAHDIPLWSMMDSLSRLLRCSWSKEVGEGSYHLLRDMASLKAEDRLRSETYRRSAAPLYEMIKYARMPDDALRNLIRGRDDEQRVSDWIRVETLRRLSNPGARAALLLAGSLSAEQQAALIARERVRLPWRAMTDSQQFIVRAILSALAEMERRHGQPVDRAPWIERFGVELRAESGLDFAIQPVMALSVNSGGQGGVYASTGDARESINLFSVRGSPYLVPQKAWEYPDIESTPFPRLPQTASLTARGWLGYLGELSRHTSMPLFSDDFVGTPDREDFNQGTPTPDVTGLPLPKALDKLCEHFGRVWWREQGALFFRSNNWFIRDAYEPPASVVALVQQQITDKEKLDVTALTTLAGLSRRQLEGLSPAILGFSDSLFLSHDIENDQQRSTIIRSKDRIRAREAHAFLQHFGALSAEQKRAAMSPGGLSIADIAEPQREAYLETLFYYRGRQALQADAAPRLIVEQWTSRPSGNPKEPAILGITLSCAPDNNGAATVFLHYLRKPATKPE